MCDSASSSIQLSGTVVNDIEMHDQGGLPRKHQALIVGVEYVDTIGSIEAVVGSLEEFNERPTTSLTDNESIDPVAPQNLPKGLDHAGGSTSILLSQALAPLALPET